MKSANLFFSAPELRGSFSDKKSRASLASGGGRCSPWDHCDGHLSIICIFRYSQEVPKWGLVCFFNITATVLCCCITYLYNNKHNNNVNAIHMLSSKYDTMLRVSLLPRQLVDVSLGKCQVSAPSGAHHY